MLAALGDCAGVIGQGFQGALQPQQQKLQAHKSCLRVGCLMSRVVKNCNITPLFFVPAAGTPPHPPHTHR